MLNENCLPSFVHNQRDCQLMHQDKALRVKEFSGFAIRITTIALRQNKVPADVKLIRSHVNLCLRGWVLYFSLKPFNLSPYPFSIQLRRGDCSMSVLDQSDHSSTKYCTPIVHALAGPRSVSFI